MQAIRFTDTQTAALSVDEKETWAAAEKETRVGRDVAACEAARQGLTLVHFSAQPEPF